MESRQNAVAFDGEGDERGNAIEEEGEGDEASGSVDGRMEKRLESGGILKSSREGGREWEINEGMMPIVKEENCKLSSGQSEVNSDN